METRHKSKRFKAATVELVLFSSDILVSITPYLVAKDVANLALSSRHLGGRPDQNTQSLSLMQEVARQVILKEQTVTEIAALPKCPAPGESWLALYHQLLLQRKPLIFDIIVGKNARYVDRNDKSRVIVTKTNNCTKSAISNHVMKAGKHYAEFSSDEQSFRSGFRAGVMRPVACWGGKKGVNHFDPTLLKNAFSIEILEGRSEKWGGSNVNCCMYDYHNGSCCWSDWEQLGSSDNAQSYETWNGQEGMTSRTFSFGEIRSGPTKISVLGLLLDLDEGTLTAYKNGRRLGIVKSGLAGEYCWVVSISSSNDAISIRRANIPVDTRAP